jgi:hypothetical protein
MGDPAGGHRNSAAGGHRDLPIGSYSTTQHAVAAAKRAWVHEHAVGTCCWGHTEPELWAQWDFGDAGLTGETARGRVADTVRNESRARARRGPTTVEPHSMASVDAIVIIDGWPPIRAVARTGGNDVTALDETQQPAGSSRSLLPVVKAITSRQAGSRPLLVRFSGAEGDCEDSRNRATSGCPVRVGCCSRSHIRLLASTELQAPSVSSGRERDVCRPSLVVRGAATEQVHGGSRETPQGGGSVVACSAVSCSCTP